MQRSAYYWADERSNISNGHTQKIIHRTFSHISIISNTMTSIEQLPNELLSMCFVYLDFYHMYTTFFHLNQRFNQLIRYQTRIHLHLSSIPSREFVTFCSQLNQLVRTSENYPNSIATHDKHKLKLLFEDDFFTGTFSRIRSLTLSNMDCETICSIIFDYPTKLYENLESLSLLDNIIEEDHKLKYNKECKNTLHNSHLDFVCLDLCNHLISSRMKSLKYLKLNFDPHQCRCCHPVASNHIDLYFVQFTTANQSISNLETLIIGCKWFIFLLYMPSGPCSVCY